VASPPGRSPVELAANAAKVFVEPYLDTEKRGWNFRYQIIHSHGVGVKGDIFMSTNELEVAFGLCDHIKNQFVSESGQWLLDTFGGDVASQGRFIRYGRFLNIPGPGTGHDGDANVSIELDDGIKAAVKELIKKFPWTII